MRGPAIASKRATRGREERGGRFLRKGDRANSSEPARVGSRAIPGVRRKRWTAPARRRKSLEKQARQGSSSTSQNESYVGNASAVDRAVILDDRAGVARLIEQEVLEPVDVTMRRRDDGQEEENQIGRRRTEPILPKHGRHYTKTPVASRYTPFGLRSGGLRSHIRLSARPLALLPKLTCFPKADASASGGRKWREACILSLRIETSEEKGIDMGTILIVLLVLFVLGGGGFWYRRRRI